MTRPQTRTPVHSRSFTTGVQPPESFELNTAGIRATESSIRLAHGCHLLAIAPLGEPRLVTRRGRHRVRHELTSQRIRLVFGESRPGTTGCILSTPLEGVTDSVTHR